MKTYFVLNHAGNIIMLGVRSIKKYEDIISINNDEDSEDYKSQYYFHTVEFDEFLAPIKIRQQKIDPQTGEVIWSAKKNQEYILKPAFKYEPLEGGGFICFDLWGKKCQELYREKDIEIIYNEKQDKSKFFIEFEDDDAALLWIETMRDEYHVRGEE